MQQERVLILESTMHLISLLGSESGLLLKSESEGIEPQSASEALVRARSSS